jgi:hypothetical protein
MKGTAGGVCMLLAQPGAVGLAAQLSVSIAEGARGHGVRRVEVAGASEQLRQSATGAIGYVYDVLASEKYLNRRLLVRISPGADLAAATGDSGGLAFALAFALAAAPRGQISVAATGILGDDGSIQPVNGVPQKLAAALAVLPPGGILVFPGGNERDVAPALRAQAMARQITLLPGYRLEEVLARLGFAITHTWLDSPFRGLEAFAFRHASIFFGRDAEIDAVLDQLSRRAGAGKPAVLVRGTSGSGKSSLVQAGVLPALLRRAEAGRAFRWGLLRQVAADAPGMEAEALHEALYAAWTHDEPGGVDAPAPPFETALDAAQCLRWLQIHSGGTEKNFFPLLVLDQMEGWFQGQLPPDLLRALSGFLAELNAAGVWIIGTITNAGMALLNPYPELTRIFEIEGQYVLPAVSVASLDAMIRQPARAAGLKFELGLDTEIFHAASHGGADVLPLLQMLLTELFERRDKARNELGYADFQAVGGLDGVISTRAEAAYESLDPGAQAALPAMLWKLRTHGFILLGDYPKDHPMRGLIAAFCGRRLLVIDERPQSVAVSAAHEALFRHWPRALAQVSRDEADVKFYSDLAREAAQWARQERALIPAGPQLNAATALIQRREDEWTDIDRPVLDYVAQSAMRMNRRRMLAYAAVGLPLLLGAAAASRSGYDYFESLFVKRITFDGIDVPDDYDGLPAQAFLFHQGIKISQIEPQFYNIILRSALSLYGGAMEDSVTRGNVLTQQPPPPGDNTAPVSFSLALDMPVRALRITRAALWGKTGSGVTHPSWRAEAYDAAGTLVATVSEPLLGSYNTIPQKAFELRATGGEDIESVRITSDYRLNGKPFAGSHAVLIREIDLVLR